MYNTKVFGDKKPTSWSVVFEEQNLPDGKTNKGRIQAFDGPIYIADAALYLMKKNPALGIQDPYELNETQYKAALDLLRGQRKLVGKYWHDAFVQIDDFTNEGVVASSSWQFQANILGSKKVPVATVIPTEGATGWADSTMMHADAKNPNCAYMWLEHSLNPKLRAICRPGSDPCLRYPLLARATRCWATPAATARATRTSSAFPSGRRRPPSARRKTTSASPITSGCRTSSPS